MNNYDWWLCGDCRKKNEYVSRNTLCSADINNVCKQARQNIYRFASLICYVKKYICNSHCFEVGINITYLVWWMVQERKKIDYLSMDFVTSYFGTNEPLTSWTLFSSLFAGSVLIRCSTGQRFICTEGTCYKIHT